VVEDVEARKRALRAELRERRRVKPATTAPLIAALARLDALAKGLTRGNAWESLQRVALALCGAVAPPDPHTL